MLDFLRKKHYNLHFNREENGNWYIVLPNYPFSHANLQMVCGADKLLSELANDKNNVHCTVSLEEVPEEEKSILLNRFTVQYGADYIVEGAKTRKLWLCPVTLYVFGKYPEKMYIHNITTD